MAKRFILAAGLFASSCAGARAVQFHPPAPAPAGLVTGYGVEKIAGNADRARQTAYLKAMDDLLTRSGPVLVSKTVQDQTTVIGVRPANRLLESTFRLRASRMLQPSFERTGVDHGFVWVLLATTDEEIERGWRQFVEWRALRIEQARRLFQEATGPQRVELLKRSLALLEDAGAADDPSMLYYKVKAELDAELTRIAHIEKFQKEFRSLTDNGQLDAAERALEAAQLSGLDQPSYHKCTAELSERRGQAVQLILAGDDSVREERYKEARTRYEQARKLDRDNSLLPGKIAMVDRFEREARARNVRAVVGFVVPAAAKTLGDYFEFKREEERRKREEAERAAEEEKQRRNEEPPPSRNPRRPRRHRLD